MSYKLETTALISKENYNAFRIRCIMLILDKLLNYSGFKNIIPTSSFSKLLGIELVVCS